MKNLTITAIALAVGFAFSGGAIAQGMSKDDYQAGKQRVASDYKSAKANCDSLSANQNDICMAQAKGSERIAMAELDASFKPTTTTRYKARVARADADYAVAKERCDEMAGNTKDVCVKESKAAQTTAVADAKAQMKSSDAVDKANEKSTDARKSASEDKLEAQYAVAKEKCDVYAGGAKDVCLDRAKVRFGKS